jgi:hypothetical protein
MRFMKDNTEKVVTAMISALNIRTFIIAFLVLAGLIVSDLPASKKGAVPAYDDTFRPFQVGEELRYDIRWGIIPAGKGTLVVPRHAGADGVYHIVTTARSNAFIDTFYKVRNRIETFLDLKRNTSAGYKKIQREGTHKRDVSLVFDHDQSEATLIRNGKVRRTIAVPSNIHDPLSAIYYLRTIKSFDEGPVVLNVTDGKRTYQVAIRIHGRETIETPMGFFDTVKIEPIIEDMEIIFDKKKGGRLYIWLSDDARKVPVKMQSELYFGSIQVLLTEAKTLS